MAKDPTDRSTLDFIAPALHVACGQVLTDREQRIAIVAKLGRDSVYLVRVKAGMLRVTQVSAQELVDTWSHADCFCEHAVAMLRELGRQHGVTDAARKALDRLAQAGREPRQGSLFG